MSDFTATWGWPQWTIVIIFLLRMSMASALHGRERRETSGERKGDVERYNAFSTLIGTFVIVAVLICGGFFA